MFSRLTTVFTVVSLAMFASASVVARTNPHNPPPSNQCNTGSIQCYWSDPYVKTLAGPLGLSTIEGTVGLSCTPITVVSGGGNSCTSQTACCTGNNFNGVLVIGCSPMTVTV